MERKIEFKDLAKFLAEKEARNPSFIFENFWADERGIYVDICKPEFDWYIPILIEEAVREYLTKVYAEDVIFNLEWVVKCEDGRFVLTILGVDIL